MLVASPGLVHDRGCKGWYMYQSNSKAVAGMLLQHVMLGRVLLGLAEIFSPRAPNQVTLTYF